VSTTERWASFDCYGTLIDWNGGLRASLGSDELLERYHEVEPQVQAENPRRSYRDVMTEVSRRLGVADEDALARSLPAWEPFPEVRPALEEARGRGWKLAILSNTDRDFIEASMERIGVPFELAIVASEIGSYKPRHAHWQQFFERVDIPYNRYVHVAQSHFHDIVPARELGLRSVWINRYGERHAPGATRELPDLTRLPETLDELAA
jgi:2-haloacid dehalogenase